MTGNAKKQNDAAVQGQAGAIASAPEDAERAHSALALEDEGGENAEDATAQAGDTGVRESSDGTTEAQPGPIPAEDEDEDEGIVYYIDFENVHGAGLEGIDRLGPQDRVVIVYSNNACTMDLSAVAALKASVAQIDFVPVSAGGQNALDFQLITMVYLDAAHNTCMHCIVSQDKGFEHSIRMAGEMGYCNVTRQETIAGAKITGSKKRRRRQAKQKSQVAAAEKAPAVQGFAASPTSAAAAAAAPVPDAEAAPGFASEAVPEPAASTAGADAEQVAEAKPDAEAKLLDEGEPEAKEGASKDDAASKRKPRQRRRRTSAKADSEAVATREAAGEPEQEPHASAENPADASATASRAKSEAPAPEAAAPAAPAAPAALEEVATSEAAPAAAAAEATPEVKPADAPAPKRAPKRARKSAPKPVVEPAPESDAKAEAPQCADSAVADVRQELERILAERLGEKPTDRQMEVTYEALERGGGKTKFYNYLRGNLGQEQGLAYYREIKGCYERLVAVVSACISNGPKGNDA